MGLKNKVSKTKEQLQEQKTQEKYFLKDVTLHIGVLQDAKIGAEGLASVCYFLEDEFNRETDASLESRSQRVFAGLAEVVDALHHCLQRETDALEREVWGREKLLGFRRPGAIEKKPADSPAS